MLGGLVVPRPRLLPDDGSHAGVGLDFVGTDAHIDFGSDFVGEGEDEVGDDVILVLRVEGRAEEKHVA